MIIAVVGGKFKAKELNKLKVRGKMTVEEAIKNDKLNRHMEGVLVDGESQ